MDIRHTPEVIQKAKELAEERNRLFNSLADHIVIVSAGSITLLAGFAGSSTLVPRRYITTSWIFFGITILAGILARYFYVVVLDKRFNRLQPGNEKTSTEKIGHRCWKIFYHAHIVSFVLAYITLIIGAVFNP